MKRMIRPAKNPRLWIALLTLVLLPTLVILVNRGIDAHFIDRFPQAVPAATPGPEECLPPIPPELDDVLAGIVPGLDVDQKTAERMQALFNADQAARLTPGLLNDPQTLEAEDAQRRVEVLAYLEQGLVSSPRDLVYAAFIFQHGNCPDHYLLANRLAQLAMDAGYYKARWIYAATLDRYLMSTGQPQKYGTQYHLVDDRMELYPVDPQTTDEERQQYNVPPLAEAQARVGEMRSASQLVVVRVLESWWLMMLGIGFALLGVVAAVVAPRRADRVVVVALGSAVIASVLSALGHFWQAQALVQDPQRAEWYATLFLILTAITGAALVGQVVWAVRQLRH